MSRVRPIRVAVVGCGHMGSSHARKVRALAAAEGVVVLSGVADVDAEAARSLAQELRARAETDAAKLYRDCDAAIVAVPTVEHAAAVRSALEAGLDVLVEKPIAATLEQGEGLLSLARERGRVLQVGHLEWFNPALRAMRQRIRSPRFVEAHRLSPFSDRATDIDVVRDLMIHDLDILQQLLGAPPSRIEAIGTPVLTQSIDIANARLVYPDGCIANLTASRVSVASMRKIRFFQADGYFSIDFLAQSVSIFRRLRAEPQGAPRIELEELKIDADDALDAQLRAFVEAIETRSVSGGTGSDALGALRTALRVIEGMPAIEEPR